MICTLKMRVLFPVTLFIYVYIYTYINFYFLLTIFLMSQSTVISRMFEGLIMENCSN